MVTYGSRSFRSFIIRHQEEALEFVLDLRISAHALNRWNIREGCDSSLSKNPVSELANFIESSEKIQKALCVLYADGNYEVLTKKGYAIGFKHEHIFYVTCLKEDGLVIVTTHNTVAMRREFNMKPGEYYFDSEHNLRIA